MAAGLIAASGLLHAVQTGAWGGAERRSQAVLRLANVPLNLGDWRGGELPIERRQIEAAGADGVLSRTYVKPPGAGIGVMLLCGPHGPISVHPPTVCFTSAGFRQSSPAERHVVLDDEHRELGVFWVADFDKTADGVPVRIRTYWAWSDGGVWSAPEHARLTYAGDAVLYKLYATRVVGPDESASDRFETTDQLLRQFLPAISRTAF